MHQFFFYHRQCAGWITTKLWLLPFYFLKYVISIVSVIRNTAESWIFKKCKYIPLKLKLIMLWNLLSLTEACTDNVLWAHTQTTAVLRLKQHMLHICIIIRIQVCHCMIVMERATEHFIVTRSTQDEIQEKLPGYCQSAPGWIILSILLTFWKLPNRICWWGPHQNHCKILHTLVRIIHKLVMSIWKTNGLNAGCH